MCEFKTGEMEGSADELMGKEVVKITAYLNQHKYNIYIIKLLVLFSQQK